jgi:dipeptidyl aminopeptidase/acylaminoacyl peptidase
VGVSNDHAELEGVLGNDRNQSSRVNAILDYYGATNLTTILAQSTPFGLNVRKPALELLLGALPDSTRQLAQLASPVNHIDKTDPPILIFHGDQDPQMPINQSHELEGLYRKLNLDVHFEVVHGAAHGGNVFYTGDNLKLAVNFINRTIK